MDYSGYGWVIRERLIDLRFPQISIFSNLASMANNKFKPNSIKCGWAVGHYCFVWSQEHISHITSTIPIFNRLAYVMPNRSLANLHVGRLQAH